MKKLVSLLILAALVATAICGCSAGTASEKELYEFGIETAKTMKKLIKSKEYAELYDLPDEVIAFADGIDMSGLDDPDAVYEIILPEASELSDELFGADWDDFSDAIQTQLENKINFSILANQINATQGTSPLVTNSAYAAMLEDETIKLDAPVTYLYVYESGTVIAVTFGEHGSAHGQFIFTDDPEDAHEIFEDYGCSVRELDLE